MKLLFQLSRDKFVEYEVSEDTTIDEIVCFLIDQGLPDEGCYSFVHEGRRLEGTFKGIKEYSIITVVVAEPAPSPKESPAQDSAPPEIIERNGLRMIRNEDFIRLFDRQMNDLGIEQVYDPECDFWGHADDCARFGQFIRHGAHERIAYNNIRRRFHQAIRYSGASVDDVYGLCGFLTVEPVLVVNEIAVAIESMPRVQRAAFNRLLQRGGRDRDSLYKLFEECNFDETETLRRLTESLGPVPVD